MSRRPSSIALLFLGALVSLVACERAELKLCGTIPQGGCPIGRGGTCDDPSCTGVYDCVDGSWRIVVDCRGAGGAGGAGSTGTGVTTTSGCTPLMFPPDEAKDCTPDLQPPDCPIAAAEQCNPCLTGCVDFFTCTKSGWKDLAYCSDEGELVIVP
ncbi:MAG: hypothetical protein U0414_42315 [Polyangiaceae bacterium]